jgi:hypothetical protein
MAMTTLDKLIPGVVIVVTMRLESVNPDTGAPTFSISTQQATSSASTTVATITVATDGSVSGTIAGAPSTLPVRTVAEPLPVDAIVEHDQTTETKVVRDSWLGPDGWMWTDRLDRGLPYRVEGWRQIGTATWPPPPTQPTG